MRLTTSTQSPLVNKMAPEIKRISINSIETFRGEHNILAVGIEYDFNKEPFFDKFTGEKYYAVLQRTIMRIDRLTYKCHIRFNCYSDIDFSKENTKVALQKITKLLNENFCDKPNSPLRSAIDDAITMMAHHTDKKRADIEEAWRKAQSK